jgi:spermidine synthase
VTLAVHLLFLVSGALGLVYEVLWIRQLTAVFGGTTLATTATLSGFFLGLAVGSAAFGRRARSWRRPLVAFGLLEVGVGLGALLVRPIASLYGQLYPGLHSTLAPFPAGFALVKLVLAMAAVGLPALCMGGTLPALAQAMAPRSGRPGASAGGLYALNVLGAAAGALAVPFVLLPSLGVNRTTLCAAAGSVAVGMLACALGRRPRMAEDTGPAAADERVGGPVLALAFVSGAATLALQVLWMRMFAFVHESAVHSIAVVLAVFLLGLAGGAALARAALRRARPPQRLLAGAWLVAAALVVASPRLFHHLTDGFAYLAADTWTRTLGRLAALAAATLLPATIALGMAFPLLMHRAAPTRSVTGPALGRLLAANTLGAIVGPLLATFLVAPRLGLWWSIVGVGLLLAASAAASLPRRGALATAAGAGVVLLLAPARLPAVRLAPGERVVSVREGSYGTTAVLADAHDRWITQNNAYVLGGAAAATEERFQAHLPLLLHPAPRRVAFLGLGTGISAGGALAHGVESVVALEIVPEVVEAARADFADLNGGVVDDPRVTVVADDGRNHLAARPHAFDVVVGDLLVPWRAAEAPLYTQEHFASVRRALAEDGLFCQWLPLYQLSEEQLAVLVNTFVEVFPRTTVWRGNFLPDQATLALVGQAGPRPLDAEAIDRRLRALPAAVAADNPFLAHPAGLWLSLVGPATADPPLARGRRNRDALPWIELLSARHRETRPPPSWPLLDTAARAPLEGTALGALDAEHAAWRTAGAALARAALDRGPAGERAALDVLRTLPPELRAALGVD